MRPPESSPLPAEREGAAAASLRRRYRRLLWAYPQWYRAERGLEVLTTLLDAARPGRRWPTAGEAVDVVLAGVRCRLRPPHPAYLLLYLPLVAFTAVLGSALAVRVTFAVIAPSPTEDEAVAVAVAATGQHPVNVPAPPVRCGDFCFVRWDPKGDQVVAEDLPFHRNLGQDLAIVGYWTPDADLATWVRQGHDRLAADGWTVGAMSVRFGTTYSFSAEKNGLSVSMAGTVGVDRGPPPGADLPLYTPASLTLTRRPPGIAAVSVVGFLGGLLAGWLLTGWGIHRYRRHRGGRRIAIVSAGIGAIVSIMTIEALLAFMVVLSLRYADVDDLVLMPAQKTDFLSLIVLPGLLPPALTIVAAALPYRSRSAPIRPALVA